jgi:hypothetical protein
MPSIIQRKMTGGPLDGETIEIVIDAAHPVLEEFRILGKGEYVPKRNLNENGFRELAFEAK